jgi:threonine dehydrogenase-like Zn-dependent dehydrogenase
VDTIESRLDMARRQGAEVINFNEEDPVETIKGFTGGIGVDRAIDAVGVDADRPHHGPGAKKSGAHKREFAQEREKVAPKTKEDGPNWHPGDAPSQALRWAVDALAKAGTLSIVGVYPSTSDNFPIGAAMNKNLTIKMGNCNHRKYIPKLLELVRTGAVQPAEILTHVGPLTAALEAYKEFDRREPGWIKVKLEPVAPAAA